MGGGGCSRSCQLTALLALSQFKLVDSYVSELAEKMITIQICHILTVSFTYFLKALICT